MDSEAPLLFVKLWIADCLLALSSSVVCTGRCSSNDIRNPQMNTEQMMEEYIVRWDTKTGAWSHYNKMLAADIADLIYKCFGEVKKSAESPIAL